jgi:hypothetical protein
MTWKVIFLKKYFSWSKLLTNNPPKEIKQNKQPNNHPENKQQKPIKQNIEPVEPIKETFRAMVQNNRRDAKPQTYTNTPKSK